MNIQWQNEKGLARHNARRYGGERNNYAANKIYYSGTLTRLLSSTNNNIQVIINGKGTLNHRTVGMAHEFGHVILYLRGLPFSHGKTGVDDFVYGRSTIMSKRLGYDY